MSGVIKKILLHACCGPCLTHCVESLGSQDYEPVVFFSDSNIMPLDEYRRRRDAARDYAAKAAVEFVEDVYDNDNWLQSVRGLEAEPEGGRRCSVCFRHNIRRAAEHACEHGFAEFTSTLTVSPHKRSMTPPLNGPVQVLDSAENPAFLEKEAGETPPPLFRIVIGLPILIDFPLVTRSGFRSGFRG